MVGWILDGTVWSLFIDCIGFVSAFLSRSQQNAFSSLLLLLLSCFFEDEVIFVFVGVKLGFDHSRAMRLANMALEPFALLLRHAWQY